MKKLVLAALFALSVFTGITAGAEEIIKIQQNNVVKRSKEIGSGNGIVFTLPDLNTSDFVIESIELGIFEKKQTDTNYKIFGTTKTVENPVSLNVTFDFGDVSKYASGAKYKIGYRYYVRSADDPAILEIAGSDTKEGWRLIGEIDPVKSSLPGFSFYLNSPPTVSVKNISWRDEDINGAKTFTYTPAQLANVYLPKHALSDGITVNFTATDPDTEDALIMYYKLINKANNSVIADTVLGSNKRLTSSTTATNIDLILYAVDEYGSRAESALVTLKIDRQLPVVTSQFQSMGKSIRGKEIYSKFVLTDDSGVALSKGNVYYSIKRGGTSVIDTIKLANNSKGEYIINRKNQSDGVYEITITAFDKAYNKLIHTLTLTLDNTPPTLRFVPQVEDARATVYNAWVNYNKNIVVDIADSSGTKSIVCRENNTSVYSGNGTGIKSIAVPDKTGKLGFTINLEDAACTVDKANNKVNSNSQGNTSTFTNSVWIDKNLPSVTVNADENQWYNLPVTIYADFNDYESAPGKGDNSGIKTKQYQIGDAITTNWNTYTNGVEFSSGGTYYLHVKASDNAGNERIISKKIKVNSPPSIGKVRPANDYLHTIFNSLNDLYIIKNTAFNTKYTFDVSDADSADTIKADAKLVSMDDNSFYSAATAYANSNGNMSRSVQFNMPYLTADGSVLPDGVYEMYTTVSEIKNDGDILTNYSNVKACEVVIKRSSPPKPKVTYENGILTIIYPDEPLSDSLNNTYIKSLYKREYKIVKDGQPDTNVYKPYANDITDIDYDGNVTALYTDPAGNISTASLRVFGSLNNGGNGGGKNLQKDGNSARLEEGRPANIYYIGIRRDNNIGVETDCFNFLN